MLIVVVILAIIAAIAVPMAQTTSTTKLISAARLLVADVEFARSESITHADDPRLIRVDTATDRYWIAAAADPLTPVDDPAGPDPLLVQFGTGRAAALGGVTIESISLGGDSELRFDAFGRPDQTTAATITLACDGATMTVQVDPETGEVSVP